MSHHEKTDKQVVITQLICFLLASVIGFTADLFDKEGREVIYKFVDAIFIIGTILVAMKLAREGWDMAAAGYTLLSIAWGVVAPFAKRSSMICNNVKRISGLSGCKPKSSSISSVVLAIIFSHRIYVPSSLAAVRASINLFIE